MSSHVSATVPWEEGTDEDFKELREGLERMRRGEVSVRVEGGSEENSDSEVENIPSYQSYGVTQRTEEDSDSDSDSDSDVDPGDSSPGERLLWAGQHNRLEVMSSLLGASPELVHYTDSDLYTALHRAAYSHHLPALELLLQHGADPGARTEDGWTPLHCAARWNSYLCVERLLLEVPVNVVTRGGQTPLHLACNSNNRQTLELLLSHPDIDPTIANSQGDLPVDVARRMGSLAPLLEAVSPPALLSHKEH